MRNAVWHHEFGLIHWKQKRHFGSILTFLLQFSHCTKSFLLLPQHPPKSTPCYRERMFILTCLFLCVTTLLSKFSLHWPADSTVSTKLPSVIYRKREMGPQLQDGALQDAQQETAALSGGGNLLPNTKLLRNAIVGFYATETNDGTSSHEWLLHTLGYVTLCYGQHLYYSLSLFPINPIESRTTHENTALRKRKCVSA